MALIALGAVTGAFIYRENWHEKREATATRIIEYKNNIIRSSDSLHYSEMMKAKADCDSAKLAEAAGRIAELKEAAAKNQAVVDEALHNATAVLQSQRKVRRNINEALRKVGKQ